MASQTSILIVVTFNELCYEWLAWLDKDIFQSMQVLAFTQVVPGLGAYSHHSCLSSND